MAVVSAGRAFLLDVGHFSIRGDLAIVTGHAPASERREAEEMNKTHHGNVRSENQQFLYRIKRRCETDGRSTIAASIARFSALFIKSTNVGRKRISGRLQNSDYSRPDF